jgi:hypothetical protein
VFSAISLRIEHNAGAARIVALSVMRNPDKLARLQAALAHDEVLAVDPRS